MVDPVPELLGPKGLLADRVQLDRQFVARQPQQVAPAVGRDWKRWRMKRGLGKNARSLVRRKLRRQALDRRMALLYPPL